MSKDLHWIDTDFSSIEFTTEMYIKKTWNLIIFGLWHIHAMSTLCQRRIKVAVGQWLFLQFTLPLLLNLNWRERFFLFHMQYCGIIPHPTLLHYCRIAKILLVALFRKYVEHKVLGIWPCTLLHCLIYGRIYSSNLVNK